MLIPQTEVILEFAGRELCRRTLPPGEYIIGRDRTCDIVAEGTKVSRRHAQLSLRYSDWLIEDLGSSNGTWVCGERVLLPTLLFPRQPVRLGNVDLILRRLPVEFSGRIDDAPQMEAVWRFLPPELRDHRRYQVRRMIAMGGMGAVLQVEDLCLRRVVAMKVLLGVDSPEHIARFVEEAQVTAQLSHPNIVPIYDINVNERENPFFTMKLFEGVTLRKVLAGVCDGDPAFISRFPLEEILRILGKACDAIAYAHAKGVVHRDLKPENLMVGNFGEVLVIDWGLAKLCCVPIQPSGEAMVYSTIVGSARQDAGQEFATGAFGTVGTPLYMAPEQAAGNHDAIDGRTDIYALGAILYQILTFRPPVEGRDAREVMENVIAGRIADIRECLRWTGDVIDGLASVAMTALSLRSDDRYQTVRQFQQEVRRSFIMRRSEAGLETVIRQGQP